MPGALETEILLSGQRALLVTFGFDFLELEPRGFRLCITQAEAFPFIVSIMVSSSLNHLAHLAQEKVSYEPYNFQVSLTAFFCKSASFVLSCAETGIAE